jgi:hypothetical protein
MVVPLTMTPAPGTGELSSAEMTLPDTLRVCAMDTTVTRLSANKRRTLFISVLIRLIINELNLQEDTFSKARSL